MSKENKDKQIEKGPLKTDSKNQYGELYQDDEEQNRSSSTNNDAVMDQAHKISKEKARAHKESKS